MSVSMEVFDPSTTNEDIIEFGTRNRNQFMTVILAGCSNITGPGVLELFRLCPNIVSIDVSYCNKSTRDNNTLSYITSRMKSAISRKWHHVGAGDNIAKANQKGGAPKKRKAPAAAEPKRKQAKRNGAATTTSAPRAKRGAQDAFGKADGDSAPAKKRDRQSRSPLLVPLTPTPPA